ncbi:hypothetical protein ACJMK2_038885 [Sinanodonta woodiana]|uniref:SCP domain-containing protein n=1 Tax=Sinanodonta woodiana TaxID=1069815 RepID=A0ABD3WE83_SINWO
MRRITHPCREREKKALSWGPLHSFSLRTQRKLKRISCSLDRLQDNLRFEQIKITQDLEQNVNRVNDTVQYDINDVKARVTALEKLIILKRMKSSPIATNLNNLVPDNVRLGIKVGTPWPVPSNSNQFRKASSLDALDEHRQSSLHLDWDDMGSGQSDAIKQPGLRKEGRVKKTSASEEALYSECDLASSYKSVSENEFDALLNLQLLLSDLNDDWKSELTQHMSNSWCLPEKEQKEKFKSRIIKFHAFRQEVFIAHNCYRRFHNSSELCLADDLTRHAQEWANDLASKGYPLYSELTDRGENVVNVHIPDETNLSGFDVCRQWYEEGKLFNFSTPKWQKGTRHFTQMIWKSSTEIGIGIAKVQGQSRYIIVVHYRPPGNGNMPGEFLQNIKPPSLLK